MFVCLFVCLLLVGWLVLQRTAMLVVHCLFVGCSLVGCLLVVVIVVLLAVVVVTVVTVVVCLFVCLFVGCCLLTVMQQIITLLDIVVGHRWQTTTVGCSCLLMLLAIISVQHATMSCLFVVVCLLVVRFSFMCHAINNESTSNCVVCLVFVLLSDCY